MTISEYMEMLASQHRLVRHGEDEVHFSCLAEDAQNMYAHAMSYPCIVVDEGDFEIAGSEGQPVIDDAVTFLVLTHVVDTADSSEVIDAFKLTRQITKDILKRMIRDRKAGVKPLKRFRIVGCSGQRIYLQDAGLYGYAVILSSGEVMTELDCDNSWM